MPKRIGYVWEELVDIVNCEQAVLDSIRRKKKTRFLRHVKDNYEEYGYRIQQIMLNGWEPDPIRRKVINEGTNQKVRELKIPSLRDHMIHTAVALVLDKYLSKRFYFYACGSLPGKGQTFAVKAVESRLRKKKPRYCAVADVQKFYKSLRPHHIMKCLKRVFKDKKFLRINRQILDQMGDELAIGFTVSHWYGHLALSYVDMELKKCHKKLFLVRFMDNFIVLGGRKRDLHKAIRTIMRVLRWFKLRVKRDWQVFPIRARMVEFLSYRMDYTKTILRKGLMYKLARRFKAAKRHIDAHSARTIVSYRGILKHCDSYNFRKSYLYPNVSLKLCRRLISDADKKRILQYAA